MSKILIVDDDRAILELLSIQFKASGHNPVSTIYPEYLFEILKGDTDIELIILDYYMPGINVPEVLQQLKSHPDYQHIPVIILTGESEEEVMQLCIQAGASEVINKPVREYILQEAVNRQLKRA